MRIIKSSMRPAKIVLFLICLTLLRDLEADVFTLWPFSRGRSGGSGAGTPGEAVGAKKLWSERTEINGLGLDMELALIDMSVYECLRYMKRLFPKANFRIGRFSFLMEIRRENGMRRRLFIVQLAPGTPAMQFAMDLPEKMPSRYAWPSEIPLPPGSVPVTYIRLPDRGSVYGSFRTALPPSQALTELTKSALSGGWRPLTSENRASLSGHGEFFLRNRSGEVMVVCFSEAPNGMTRGTVYTKKLKK